MERRPNERKQVHGKTKMSIGIDEEIDKLVNRKDGRRKAKIMSNKTVRFEIGERNRPARADTGRSNSGGLGLKATEVETTERNEGVCTNEGVEYKRRGVETKAGRRRFSMFMVVTFAAALCYVSMAAYTTGVVRTLERRFSLSSFRTGLIRSGNDIGHICAVVFVAYFGRKVDRLRTLSLSVFLAAVAGLLMATPHFFLASSSPFSSTAFPSSTESVTKSTRSNLCSSQKVSSAFNATFASSTSIAFSSSSTPFFFQRTSSSNSTIYTSYHSSPSSHSSYSSASSIPSAASTDLKDGLVQETEEGVHLVFYVFLVGHLIKGVGGSGIFALSMSYIDGYASTSKSAFYTGKLFTKCYSPIYSIGCSDHRFSSIAFSASEFQKIKLYDNWSLVKFITSWFYPSGKVNV